MGRYRGSYTKLGMKIYGLCSTQRQLAEVLQLTQQSVSGKLTGKIAITMKDLENLSEHFDVPMAYFVLPESVTPEIARSSYKVFESPEMREIIELASGFDRMFAVQLLKIVQAMSRTSSYLESRNFISDQIHFA